MHLRFLGKESSQGDSPTLYATDRESYVVQGYLVTDPEVLAKLQIPESETCVEIYARLLSHLAKDGLRGTITSWRPPIVHVKANGDLIVQGKRVTDADALAQIALPAGEDCVEVTTAALRSLMEENDHGVDDS
ncbi:hypothetical protein [Actinoallomurus sp. NPDC050550]|uniref:hypothetical protein n=1 Tax=Actinoallomurus sp. NPDC050550 TaxID=3154937 RepID=UPI0033FDEC24